MVIREHHPGYIAFDKFLENRRWIRANAMMMRHQGKGDESGPVREGPALLQGLARGGRRMMLGYGRSASTLGRPSESGSGFLFSLRGVIFAIADSPGVFPACENNHKTGGSAPILSFSTSCLCSA